jgi:uncharacterized protein YcbX
MPHIHSIYRYPIKGLSPEALARAALEPGATIAGDRLYAIANGPSGFDPASPSYLSKTHFLMLMKNERLASLRTTFDQESHVLTITSPSPHTSPSPLVGEGGVGGREGKSLPSTPASHLPTPTPNPSPTSLHSGARKRDPGGGGENKISADLRSAAGRAAIERFFAEFCAGELRGPPKILQAPGHSFSDVARKVVSIINLNSVAAIEDMVGAPVHPLRFRGNVYVEGWPAWSELDLVGKELKIIARAGAAGAMRPHARLKVVKRIVRCAATNVDPLTGIRDLELPKALLRHLGHGDCGIYAEVVEAGEIAAGDEIEII